MRTPKLKLPASITESIDYVISMVLMRPDFGCRNLKPETVLSINVADAFRRHTKDGRYRGIFTHIPNEGKRSSFSGAITKAMGMIAGFADFLFIWRVRGGLFGVALIELKIPGNALNPNQKLFQRFCAHFGIPYSVCHSVTEVEATLRGLGGLA